MIACGRCGSVNEEHDEFCQSCGGFLDATGRTAVTDDPAVAAPSTSAAGPAEAGSALLRATEHRIDAEAEAARALEAARAAELAAEEARSLERAARQTVVEAAGSSSDADSPRPPSEVVVAPDVDHQAQPDDRDRRAAALLVGWDAPTAAPAVPTAAPVVPPPAVPTPVAPSQAVPGSVPCAGCGRLNEGRLRFCSKCGTRLGGGQVDP